MCRWKCVNDEISSSNNYPVHSFHDSPFSLSCILPISIWNFEFLDPSWLNLTFLPLSEGLKEYLNNWTSLLGYYFGCNSATENRSHGQPKHGADPGQSKHGTDHHTQHCRMAQNPRTIIVYQQQPPRLTIVRWELDHLRISDGTFNSHLTLTISSLCNVRQGHIIINTVSHSSIRNHQSSYTSTVKLNETFLSTIHAISHWLSRLSTAYYVVYNQLFPAQIFSRAIKPNYSALPIFVFPCLSFPLSMYWTCLVLLTTR